MTHRTETLRFRSREEMEKRTRRMVASGWTVQRVTALAGGSREVTLSLWTPDARDERRKAVG